MKVLLGSLLLFSSFFLFSNELHSMSICPPDSGTNCTPWETGKYTTTTSNPSCNLEVDYHYRICDHVYQIYIDRVMQYGNCQYLSDFGNLSAFNEWLQLILIEEILNINSTIDPTDCPETTSKAIFYTASCGLWVQCEYTIDSTSRKCDVDWRGDYPDYPVGGVRKLKFWKFQPCGETCCKKTYTVCRVPNGTDGGYTLNIHSVIREKIGDCTNPDEFVSPCEDGC